MTPPSTKEKLFDQFLISEYLKHGSIEKVFSIHKYDLPLSFATYHRVLNKYGIVKSAGPNSKLSESLDVLSKLANYRLPLERIYNQHAPTSIKVSTNTLHRMLHYVRLRVTRRLGTALLITRQSEPDKFLLAQDKSLTQPKLGQPNDFSLPMTHSRMQDSPKQAISRVLQQEVFTKETIDLSFPQDLNLNDQKPLFYINIADIKVAVFQITIPDTYQNFSSFKLDHYQFLTPEEISKLKLRPGVWDILNEATRQRFYPSSKPLVIDSSLNSLLYAWCSKI